MNQQELENIVKQGENEYVEFKRCGNQSEADVFETLCAFANGFGGTLFLGIEDDGTLRGVSPDQMLGITRNIHNVINNPNAFDVPIPLEFEQIEVEGRRIIKISVPNSPQMHSYKGRVYERRGDSDVIVRGSVPLAELCIRKQGIFTEQRIFEHVSLEDLRADLISRARAMATANRKDHPWGNLTDLQLLESAGMYGKDYSSGKTGFNLACVLTLGKDDTIRSLCPTYKTDALVRTNDTVRYDDRLTVTTNLLDAYDLLADFCRKHLPDRYVLNGDQATSARDTIVRELIVNCLIHREFTSPFPAKVIIDAEGISTENASRASFEGPLLPDSFNPLPKNPLIASFFSHIGLAEELGSGTREIFKNSRLYTGRDPILEEGSVFKTFVPTLPAEEHDPASVIPDDDLTSLIIALAKRSEGFRTGDAVLLGHPRRTIQRLTSELVEEGKLTAHGAGRGRFYRAG